MAYFKKPNLFQRILFSRGMVLALIFATIFVGYGLVSIVSKSIDASKARTMTEKQAESLRNKEENLSKKLTLLNTPDGKEAILREQFPVVRPGERVVVITDEAKTEENLQASIAEAPVAKRGFWNFLKNLFN